jgi:hypothetical protein
MSSQNPRRETAGGFSFSQSVLGACVMSVVRFKRTRRRLSIRYYLCTDDGPVRLPLRLCRDLADRVIALPQFANSSPRMVEVLIQTEADKTKSVHLRPTSTRFDVKGKVDLHHAAEAMAVVLGGSKPKRISKNVLDIGPTLRTRAREREANWRISQSMKRLILADVKGEAKLPVVRVSE